MAFRRCTMARLSVRLAAKSATALLVFAAVSFHPSRAQTPANGIIAMTGARVIDGTGHAPLDKATILIENGRIKAVGAAVKIPAGATPVDLSGKTVMPGIINAHGHLNADKSSRPARDRLSVQLGIYADYGITTVVVLGTGDND